MRRLQHGRGFPFRRLAEEICQPSHHDQQLFPTRGPWMSVGTALACSNNHHETMLRPLQQGRREEGPDLHLDAFGLECGFPEYRVPQLSRRCVCGRNWTRSKRERNSKILCERRTRRSGRLREWRRMKRFSSRGKRGRGKCWYRSGRPKYRMIRAFYWNRLKQRHVSTHD